MSTITDAFVEADLSFMKSEQYQDHGTTRDTEEFSDMDDLIDQVVGVSDTKPA